MQNTEVVTSSDVAYLIQVMGQPEQYVDTETQEDIPSKKAKLLILREKTLSRW